MAAQNAQVYPLMDGIFVFPKVHMLKPTPHEVILGVGLWEWLGLKDGAF